MGLRRLLLASAASMVLLNLATAHGGAHQKPLQVDPEASWAEKHMAGKSPSVGESSKTEKLNRGASHRQFR
jgi:hypothetical protein